VWALTEGNTATLQRIDPRNDSVTGTVDLGLGEPGGSLFYFYHSGLTVADGSLWVSEFFYNQVLRIDPSRLQVTRRIDVGRSPVSVLGVGNSVWVADFHSSSLSRIDTGLNRVVQTIAGVGDPKDFNAGPRGLAYVDGVVWANVPAQQELYGVDARTGRLVASHNAAPAYACSVLSAAPHAVILDDSLCSNSYSRFDVRTGLVTQVNAPDSSCLFGVAASPAIPGRAAGVVVTEEAHFLGDFTCSSDGDLVARDAATGSELLRLPVQDIGIELYPGGSALWADDANTPDHVLHFTVKIRSTS
jgi:DNA-binding beta-propeller fold protein YncE